MPQLPPASRRWWPALAGAAVLAAVLVVPVSGGSRDAARPAAAPAAAGRAAADLAGSTTAAVAVPAPVAPPAPPVVPVTPVGAPAPAAGQVQLAEGPFTDRVALRQASVRAGTDAAVQGTLGQLVETSALLLAQVQVDFYAADGALLGSRVKVLRQPDVVSGGVQQVGGDKRYGGDISFDVEAPVEYAPRVSAAVLSIPTLVNE